MTVVRFEKPGGAPVVADASRSRVLSPRYYTDPAVFAWEQDNIFAKSWAYAGHISQLPRPGSVFPCEIAGEPIIVARTVKDEIKAFYNVCAHRAARIVDEPVCAKSLQCPYHGWVYTLDGKLKTARRTNRTPGFEKTGIHLPAVRVEVMESFIYVNLDTDAAPMSETVGPMFEDIQKFEIDVGALKPVRQDSYTVHANWKVVVDNYVESYHTEIAHPIYVDGANWQDAYIESHEWYTLMGGPESQENLEALRRTGKLHVTENRYHLGWPNITYLFYPGPPNIFVWELLPISIDETLFRRNSFFKTDEFDAEREAQFEMDDLLTKEDIGLIERAWTGLNSRGFQGQGHYILNDQMTNQSEMAVHTFHRKCQQLYDDAGL